MQTPTAQLPTEEQPVIAARGKRLRPITPKEIFQLAQWEMDYRFVREVEYLEREGRVASRRELEESIGMTRGDLLAVRVGRRSIGLVQVKYLHDRYRGDRDYIMFGVRNKDLYTAYIPGVGRIDRYEPYIYEYQSPARWRIGPRAETQPEYYPSDPQNEQWSAPDRMPSKTRGRGKQDDEE